MTVLLGDDLDVDRLRDVGELAIDQQASSIDLTGQGEIMRGAADQQRGEGDDGDGTHDDLHPCVGFDGISIPRINYIVNGFQSDDQLDWAALRILMNSAVVRTGG